MLAREPPALFCGRLRPAWIYIDLGNNVVGECKENEAAAKITCSRFPLKESEKKIKTLAVAKATSPDNEF